MSEDDAFGPLPPKPKSWADVFATTGNLKDVPIEEIQMGRADWEYHFASTDMRPCGRKGCKQDHGHGWLMALRGQRYVHIGNDCAEKYANKDLWNANVKSYNDRVQADARGVAIVQVREEAQRKQHWLDNSPEVDLAIELHESFLQAAKGSLLAEIEKRAEKMQTRIEREVWLTKEEVASRQVMLAGGRLEGEPGRHVSAVEQRHLGDISGLRCFRPHQSPRNLRVQLQRLVDTLLAWTPKDDDKDAMRTMMRAMRDLGPYSNDLNESVVATRQFFSEANLRTLMKLEVIKRQGIQAIERDGANKIKIVRSPHWTTRAA